METERDMLPLFDRLSDGICVTGEGGRLLYMNPAAERILGLKLAQSGDCSLCDLLCSRVSNSARPDGAKGCPLRGHGPECGVTIEGGFESGLAFAWRGGSVTRAERHRQLRVRCLKTETAWLSRAHPEKRLTVIEDVTERATLEEEREDWRSMIAHDLRNPLSNVYGALKEIEESGAGTPALLGIALGNCRRMIELLDLYLDVAKLDAALMPTDIRDVDLSAAVEECVRSQSPTAHARRVELRRKVPAGARARADATLLGRVLQNLVDNALKFTPPGGLVTIAAGEGPDGCVELSVEDTGPGIHPEELEKLFDRFHQARARREGKTTGTGLGLAFCRLALKAMGGEVFAAPGRTRGALFALRLPAVRSGR